MEAALVIPATKLCRNKRDMYYFPFELTVLLCFSSLLLNVEQTTRLSNARKKAEESGQLTEEDLRNLVRQRESEIDSLTRRLVFRFTVMINLQTHMNG